MLHQRIDLRRHVFTSGLSLQRIGVIESLLSSRRTPSSLPLASREAKPLSRYSSSEAVAGNCSALAMGWT